MFSLGEAGKSIRSCYIMERKKYIYSNKNRVKGCVCVDITM